VRKNNKTQMRQWHMKVQKYERHATPLNERIRYFFEVMFWLTVTFFVLVALLVAYWNIFELFVPTGRYTGHPAFTEDRRLCLARALEANFTTVKVNTGGLIHLREYNWVIKWFHTIITNFPSIFG
jgi:hypothetical protein